MEALLLKDLAGPQLSYLKSWGLPALWGVKVDATWRKPKTGNTYSHDYNLEFHAGEPWPGRYFSFNIRNRPRLKEKKSCLVLGSQFMKTWDFRYLPRVKISQAKYSYHWEANKENFKSSLIYVYKFDGDNSKKAFSDYTSMYFTARINFDI